MDPEQCLTRTNAKVSDNVFVTGMVGAFNTALLYFIVAKPKGLTLSYSNELYLKNKLIRPIAQVKKGKILASSGICSSCMDITDGVGGTLFELATCSEKGFLIEESKLPLHPSTKIVAEFIGIPSRDIVFGIGLDLELMGTVSCSKDNISEELGITVIGTVEAQGPNQLKTRDERLLPIPEKGWQNFAGSAMDMVKNSVLSKP